MLDTRQWSLCKNTHNLTPHTPLRGNLFKSYANFLSATFLVYPVVLYYIHMFHINVLCHSVVYGVYHAHITPLTTPLGKLNTALSRPAWTLALAWTTLACSAGYGGPVDWILSLPPFRLNFRLIIFF